MYPLAEQATLRLSKPVADIVASGGGELLETIVQGLKSAQRTGRNAHRIRCALKITGWKQTTFLR